ncbi:MAG: hypothetical protein Q8R47_03060 [Nanoarchaeota archaeon]|nr:hypothetical protein [Nanoarchaeota archaeon]
MTYLLGIYKLHDKTQYSLNQLSYKEAKLFKWMMAEYQAAASWADFQERTAKPIVEAAGKAEEQKRKEGKEEFKWEYHSLYRIRFDLLRNVGIRTGELRGELSDMLS